MTLIYLKTQIDASKIILGYFNTNFSTIDRLSRHKLSKDSSGLKNVINHMDLTGIYKIFYSTIAKFTFIPAAHETFSKTDHILGHNETLSKYKKKSLDIIACMVSDHNDIKFKNNTKTKTNLQKLHKHIETEHTVLNVEWVRQEIREEIKNS